ncbi:alpha/beta hydrolase [Nonomuraea typhae]|uniref:alpha/beta hydrolase n=1 Tax=Nonomuraea typhae TaxID=2603600 RepID=UPI0012FB7B97|nr:alpha/beta hydrolase [Nonomuraea typhae]
MADHSAASAALKRVTALALEHHNALDPAARLMHAHTWVGGGASAFATDLADHRTQLQSALSTALHALANLVVRHGGSPPAIPALTTTITSMSTPASTFQGIDPTAMAALASTLDHAGHTLPAAGTRLATELTTQGLSTHPGHSLGHVATWATTQTMDLRRRLTLIRRTVPGTTLPAAVTAYTLFAAHTPDPQGTATLLIQLARSDTDALNRLLTLQAQGPAPDLAARVNAWWHTLPTSTQTSLTTLAGFGLVNGLPATVRDQANRSWLTTEKIRLTTELNKATTAVTNPLDLGGWEVIANQLRRVDLIERASRSVPGYPAPLLLAFDLTGQGRLIVAWGNPDTANTTVTNVSGLTSGLDAAQGDLGRARALWRQAAATSGRKSIASITWLGYDAPQIDPGLFEPGRSVAFEGAAAEGGTALAAFIDGLRASHEPSGMARAVVIGHSYGSLTSGHAATLRPGRFADDLILVGSPGVGVNHASHLGLDPKHVWVGEAGGDPVTALGRFGADPGRSSFGAQSFPVGRDVWTSAHSSYWNPHSASLRNMGSIVNGQYDQLVDPPSRSNRPQLLMPEASPDLDAKLSR